MLRKYPTYIKGIDTVPLKTERLDLNPLTELFMRRSQGRGKSSGKDTKKDDIKLDATYGEGLAWQGEMNKLMGELSGLYRMYGSDKIDIVNQLPEARSIMNRMDALSSDGIINGLKRNRELADTYRKRIDEKNTGGGTAGGLPAIQILYDKGMTGRGQFATYGDVANAISQAPDLQKQFGNYNFHHPTTDANEAWTMLNQQLKLEGWQKDSASKDAYTIGSVVAATLSGVEGRYNKESMVQGYERADNEKQRQAARMGLQLDPNILHGLEVGYLTWLQQQGLTSHREGSVLTDDKGKNFAPSKDYFEVDKLTVDDQGNVGLALSGKTALFNREGKPNENYFKLMEKYIATKISAISAKNRQFQDDIKTASTNMSFTAFTGDELETKYEKNMLETMWQTGMYSNAYSEYYGIDPYRELSQTLEGTINWKGKDVKMMDLMVPELQSAIKAGKLDAKWGFVQNATQLQNYMLDGASEGDLDVINGILKKYGQMPLAKTGLPRYDGTDAILQKSESTITFTPEGNEILTDKARKLWGMKEGQELISVAQMGESPLFLGKLPKNRNEYPDGTLFRLNKGWVANAPGAKVEYDANGRPRWIYNEVPSQKDLEKALFIQRELSQLTPDQLMARTGQPYPPTIYSLLALVAKGQVLIPMGDKGKVAQDFLNQTNVLATKKWKYSDEELTENNTQDEILKWAKNKGLNVETASFSTGYRQIETMMINGKTYDYTNGFKTLASWKLDEERNGTFSMQEPLHLQEKVKLKGGKNLTIKAEKNTYDLKVHEDIEQLVGGRPEVVTFEGKDYLTLPAGYQANGLFADQLFTQTYYQNLKKLEERKRKTTGGTLPGMYQNLKIEP